MLYRQLLNDHEYLSIKEEGFGENGLRVDDIRKLQNINPHVLTRNQLTEFVDAITFIKIKNKDYEFFKRYLNAKLPNNFKPNIMTIINLSYISRYCIQHDIREKADSLLIEYLQSFPKNDFGLKS